MSIAFRAMSLCLIIALILTSCSQAATGTKSLVADKDPSSSETEIEQFPTNTIQPSKSTPIPNTPSATSAPTSTLAPSPTASWIGPEDFPEGVNPLTGLQVSDPSLLDRRPVMIKVSNYPAYLRPHSGLSFADMVWEYYIGVGMTRFLALYYGRDAPQVGPVRSGRLIDPQIVRMYGGLLGLVGADAYVWDVIKDAIPGRYVTERPLTCPALCRESVEHSVFANTSEFSEYVESIGLDNRRPDLPGMVFDPHTPDGGQRADSFWIYISYYDQVRWDYDIEAGAYLRFQESAQEDGTVELAPMTDRLTSEQLTFDNVVVLFTWHDEIKPELIDMDLINSDGRRALILRDGRLYEASYHAVSDTAPLRFYDEDGNPFPFKPGTTWFVIMGLESTLEELDQGSWKMRFYK
jgi:hypothetical protein